MLEYDFSPRYKYIIPFKAAFYELSEAELYCEKLGISLYDSFEHHYDGPLRIVTPTLTYENKFMTRAIFSYRDGFLRSVEVEDHNPTRTSFPIEVNNPGTVSPFHIETPDEAWGSEGASFYGSSSCGSYRSISLGTWTNGCSPFKPCPRFENRLEYPILIG